jgi:carbonic anhydrase
VHLLSAIVFATLVFGASAHAQEPAAADEANLPATEADQKNEEVIEKGTISLKGAKGEKPELAPKVVDRLSSPESAEEKAEAKTDAKDGMTVQMHPAKKNAAGAAKPAAKQKVVKEADAETSLRWLQNGNTRYLKKNNRADGKSAADRKRLANGQKPHAIILSCSDSRVPPEVVFDQALGEIYVVRVAGEALDSAVIATIEDAVLKLGPQLLVVMGHSQCGAVQAALDLKDGDSAGSADLDRLLQDIKPRLKTVAKETPSATLEVESAVNADGVARDLVRRSDVIRKQVEAGRLTIKTALYRMDSGKVNFY